MLMGLTDAALVGEPMSTLLGEPVSTDIGRTGEPRSTDSGRRERVLARDGTALLGDALCGLADRDEAGGGGDVDEDEEAMLRSRSVWCVSW
jgi:hypothetical protein